MRDDATTEGPRHRGGKVIVFSAGEYGLLTLTFKRSGDSPEFFGSIIDGTGQFNNARGSLKGTENSDGTADIVLSIRHR